MIYLFSLKRAVSGEPARWFSFEGSFVCCTIYIRTVLFLLTVQQFVSCPNIFLQIISGLLFVLVLVQVVSTLPSYLCNEQLYEQELYETKLIQPTFFVDK